jgi:hypothetical protein
MRNRAGIFDVIFLFAIGAVTYLPMIHRVGFTHDDWYLMYAAGAQGADVFHEIYSGIRPLRAFVMEPAYLLFEQNVLLYNLSAWGFRVLSACLLLWLLRMLWRDQRRWTLLIAAFYLIYPGFLSQPNGVDYQSQMASLALAMFSLGLTVHAFFQKHSVYKVLELTIAVLCGFLYLGLVEYEAGFEITRLTVLFILVWRTTENFRDRIITLFKIWIPNSAVIIGFGLWRTFIFESARKARDVASQLEDFRLYPLQTAYRWSVQIAQDFYDVTLSAYVTPLSQLTDHIQWWGGILAIIVTSLAVYYFNKMNAGDNQTEENSDSVTREVVTLGLATSIGGLMLIAMVNREVFFPSFSRYTLTSSVGVAMLIVAILMQVNNKTIRNALLAAGLLISVFTHHANTIKYVHATETINEFWWQASWRIPQLEKNTTLIANIPSIATEEDYFIWGPANLIYYPENQNPEITQPALFAAVLNRDTVQKTLTRERQEYDNRLSIITYKNYRNLVILTQPSPSSCVHVINGLQPEFSSAESDSIRVIGAYSELERVLVDETPHAPPELIFGPEPARGWCYFYQSADLARQRGDWESVIRLGNEAQARGFAPSDLIEWMPFLQAYAVTDDVDRLMELASVISSEPYVALQVCRNIGGLPGISSAVAEIIDSQYCLE